MVAEPDCEVVACMDGGRYQQSRVDATRCRAFVISEKVSDFDRTCVLASCLECRPMVATTLLTVERLLAS